MPACRARKAAPRRIMSEDRDKKITEAEESSERKTLIRQLRDADFPNDGKTRIYGALKGDREASSASAHKWIDDGDEPVIKPVTGHTLTDIDRETIATADSFRAPVLDRKTRVGRSSNTQVLNRRPQVLEDEPEGSAPEKTGSGAAERSAPGRAADRLRLAKRDLKNVRVADSRRFERFLKIVGAFLLILLIEIGYFGFASHVSRMPAAVKSTQKELKLTKEENRLLKEEIEALGDYSSTEELKASWEKLKEKVEKAAEETYY